MKRANQALRTLRRDARTLVETCPGALSRLAARRITQFLDQELAATGISSAQLALMAQIAAAEDDTLGALAERSGLEQSTLSRNLRTLENAGLIEIAAVESDPRRRADRDRRAAPGGCDPGLAQSAGEARTADGTDAGPAPGGGGRRRTAVTREAVAMRRSS